MILSLKSTFWPSLNALGQEIKPREAKKQIGQSRLEQNGHNSAPDNMSTMDFWYFVANHISLVPLEVIHQNKKGGSLGNCAFSEKWLLAPWRPLGHLWKSSLKWKFGFCLNVWLLKVSSQYFHPIKFCSYL